MFSSFKGNLIYLKHYVEVLLFILRMACEVDTLIILI